MTCPVCGGAMRVTYTKGVYILWKCPYCEYAEIVLSDKVDGKRGKSEFKTKSLWKEKPPQSACL